MWPSSSGTEAEQLLEWLTAASCAPSDAQRGSLTPSSGGSGHHQDDDSDTGCGGIMCYIRFGDVHLYVMLLLVVVNEDCSLCCVLWPSVLDLRINAGAKTELFWALML